MTVKGLLTGAIVAFAWALSGLGAIGVEDLSLQQAVELALKNNPTIAADQLSAEAAKHSARGARALANPEIILAPNVIGDAGSDSEALISQPLELNGSRRLRGEIAAHEANASEHNALSTRRDVALRVEQLYWDVARAQALVELSEENMRYLETLRKAAQRQLDVGSAPGSQLIKSEVELARAKQELTQAQLELAQSKSALNSLLNRSQNTEFAASDQMAFIDRAISREELPAQALSLRPEVASAREQVESANREIKAARLKRAPDLALQARKETFSGDGGVAIAVNIPFVDWGSARADKLQAESLARSREKQLEAVRNSVILDVEQAIQSVESSAMIVRESRDGILEKSQRLADMAWKGYENGATSYLEALEAQRTLRGTKIDYISALTNYVKALAQLNWATGADPAGANTPEVKL